LEKQRKKKRQTDKLNQQRQQQQQQTTETKPNKQTKKADNEKNPFTRFLVTPLRVLLTTFSAYQKNAFLVIIVSFCDRDF